MSILMVTLSELKVGMILEILQTPALHLLTVVHRWERESCKLHVLLQKNRYSMTALAIAVVIEQTRSSGLCYILSESF